MRHLWSLLAGVVAAPLAWLCLATGQYRSSLTIAKWNEENFFDTAELIGPAAFLAAAGILLGLVGTLRWSPAGPLVAGLLFVVPTIFMFINPFRTLDAFSVDQQRRLLDQDFQPWLPVVNGTLLVLGALLLMAVFSAQRWRRWPAATAPFAAAGTPEAVSPAPAPMSDEEILAAAAAMEEEEKATATAEAPAAEAEPAEPAEAEPEPEPEPAESPKPSADATDEPDNDESSTPSRSSTG